MTPSSADVLAPGVVAGERQPEDPPVHRQKDRQKILHRESLTSRGTQADHLSQNRVCLGVCVPAATDGSMPVGSGETICR
jgi:hypothetical protein